VRIIQNILQNENNNIKNPSLQKNKLEIQVHIGSKRVEKREVRNWEKEERDSMCARPSVCVQRLSACRSL
jgi:hypothetical protein